MDACTKSNDLTLFHEFEYLVERINRYSYLHNIISNYYVCIREHGFGLIVNKQTLHAGVVVAEPDGDVLVTYKGDQIQHTCVHLLFWSSGHPSGRPSKLTVLWSTPSPTKPASV